MAQIDIRNVRKSYGKVQTLHGVDLSFNSGEFIVILGPSGCGKSTLLRMIAGLEEITSGEIAIGETVVNTLEPRERGCAMVFQNYALYPHMTVAANIGYALKVAGVPKVERDRRIADTAKIVGLSDYLERRPAALSGGQRQRVAMARAIIREPKVFLFDEPLSNLDAKLRVTMRAEIRKLHKRLSATSIFVTHDQVEALTLADRLVVMNKGCVEQVGNPLDIYHKPASIFVASFIGSPAMNLVSGELHGDRLAIGPAVLSLNGVAPTSGPVTIGMRAEDLRLARDGEQGLPFHMDYLEELGSQRLVHGNVGDQALTVALSTETAVPDHLVLAISPEKLHFFDIESGKRIDARLQSHAAPAPMELSRV